MHEIAALLDLRERQPVDVDEQRRLLDVDLHEVENIRSARDEPRAPVVLDRRDRGRRVFDPRVMERIHDVPPQSRTASTICG